MATQPQEKEHLVIRYWPLIAMFITGLIGFGTLQARVSDLAKQAEVSSTDHDAVTKVSTNVDALQKQLDRVEGKLDRALDGAHR